AQPGQPGGVTVLLADAAGRFRQGPVLVAGLGAGSVAVGDVNRDGALDVVAASPGLATAPGTLSVVLGDGAGRFAAAPAVPPTTFPGGRYVALADVDRDGRPD